MREGLEKLLAAGKDSALLRLGLGNACLADGDLAMAEEHLRRAVCMDANYTAAWKQLGRVLLDSAQPTQAQHALEQGLEVARRHGDKQAEKEMQVFLKRALKAQSAGK
ncbi:tetratricopeptide repeat protein [Alcaligenes sp. SDU_A2]|uniref:tetratricopeptide repeat protein n=1 Tax=Alcaligenes sp. SDU_A2 TaxID=3136634 RepID=UPI00311EEA80